MGKGSERPAAHTQEKLNQVTPPPPPLEMALDCSKEMCPSQYNITSSSSRTLTFCQGWAPKTALVLFLRSCFLRLAK